MTACTHPRCTAQVSADSVCGIPTCGKHTCPAHMYPVEIDEDGERDFLLVCRACSEANEAALSAAQGSWD